MMKFNPYRAKLATESIESFLKRGGKITIIKRKLYPIRLTYHIHTPSRVLK